MPSVRRTVLRCNRCPATRGNDRERSNHLDQLRRYGNGGRSRHDRGGAQRYRRHVAGGQESEHESAECASVKEQRIQAELDKSRFGCYSIRFFRTEDTDQKNPRGVPHHARKKTISEDAEASKALEDFKSRACRKRFAC